MRELTLCCPGAAVPTGNELGAMVGRVQAFYLVGAQLCSCCTAPATGAQRWPCSRLVACWRACSCALCCLFLPQIGQLSIPQLPLNFRTSANQLSYIQLNYP